jgi:hypothetical protein
MAADHKAHAATLRVSSILGVSAPVFMPIDIPMRAQGAAPKLLASVSDIYFREINVRLRVSFMRVATTQRDPWPAASAAEPLVEVQSDRITNKTSHWAWGTLIASPVLHRIRICRSNDPVMANALRGMAEGMVQGKPSDCLTDYGRADFLTFAN